MATLRPHYTDQPGFTIVRFEGAQIVERHSLADFDTVVAQLTAP